MNRIVVPAVTTGAALSTTGSQQMDTKRLLVMLAAGVLGLVTACGTAPANV